MAATSPQPMLPSLPYTPDQLFFITYGQVSLHAWWIVTCRQGMIGTQWSRLIPYRDWSFTLEFLQQYGVHVQRMVPYSGKLSREKIFTDQQEVTISQRKLLWNAKAYHRWSRHAQISQRKLSRVALRPRNSWKFSLFESFPLYGITVHLFPPQPE